jgi:hypothetical protein
MKPIGGNVVDVNGNFTDMDTRYVKEVLGLTEKNKDITPLLVTETFLLDTLKGGECKYSREIKETFEKAEKGKDILLIEDFGEICTSFIFDLSPSKLAELTNSKILLIVNYSEFIIGRILAYTSLIEREKMIGVVINDVPREKIDRIGDYTIPYLEDRGIKTLGFLPRDEFLRMITPEEIAEELGGTIICGGEGSKEPIYNFIIGAMSYENALKYFRKMQDKAVITGGDRAEIQVAALETPTKALILTGNLYPNPVIMAKAEERKVPIIILSDDTFTVVQKVEDLMNKVRLKDKRKIERITRLIRENINLKKLYGEIGIE